ncbi:hypothetical protein CMMCA002_04655 [Clavibacter michiganensis subsp. michiganensis]|nr:hypothetical protein CMMCA002_04655 [Clavibacter michiganensis subsp. michiganensis]
MAHAHVPRHRGDRRGAQRDPLPHEPAGEARPDPGRQHRAPAHRAAHRRGEARDPGRRQRRQPAAAVPPVARRRRVPAPRAAARVRRTGGGGGCRPGVRSGRRAARLRRLAGRRLPRARARPGRGPAAVGRPHPHPAPRRRRAALGAHGRAGAVRRGRHTAHRAVRGLVPARAAAADAPRIRRLLRAPDHALAPLQRRRHAGRRPRRVRPAVHEQRHHPARPDPRGRGRAAAPLARVRLVGDPHHARLALLVAWRRRPAEHVHPPRGRPQGRRSRARPRPPRPRGRPGARPRRRGHDRPRRRRRRLHHVAAPGVDPQALLLASHGLRGRRVGVPRPPRRDLAPPRDRAARPDAGGRPHAGPHRPSARPRLGPRRHRRRTRGHAARRHRSGHGHGAVDPAGRSRRGIGPVRHVRALGRRGRELAGAGIRARSGTGRRRSCLRPRRHLRRRHRMAAPGRRRRRRPPPSLRPEDPA